MLRQAEMRHAGLVELKKYERGQLELASDAIRALADKGKKIQALSKRQAKLRAQRNKVAPKPGKARSDRYLTTLARLREVDTELEFCRNWVAQKERVLTAKRGKLSSLLKAMDERPLQSLFWLEEAASAAARRTQHRDHSVRLCRGLARGLGHSPKRSGLVDRTYG
jgi:hypothetical protein